jgi:hypothetical protein
MNDMAGLNVRGLRVVCPERLLGDGNLERSTKRNLIMAIPEFGCTIDKTRRVIYPGSCRLS